MNVQFAVKDNEVYLIEVNPRAARTVPFVSKATGVPLAKVAARVMAGKTLVEQGVTEEIIPPYYSVKEVVLPFNKFPGVDPILGPEMRSTGEVMGVGRTFAEAFSKAMLGSNSGMKSRAARCCRCVKATRLAWSICRQPAEAGLRAGRHPRYRGGAGRSGHQPAPGQQGARRASAHSGPYQERRVHLHRQHHGRPSGD